MPVADDPFDAEDEDFEVESGYGSPSTQPVPEFTYVERTPENAESTTTASFSFVQSSSSREYLYSFNSLSQLQDFIKDIIGDTSPNKGDGRLKRRLPHCDPEWPFLYAEQVTGVRGTGRPHGRGIRMYSRHHRLATSISTLPVDSMSALHRVHMRSWAMIVSPLKRSSITI